MWDERIRKRCEQEAIASRIHRACFHPVSLLGFGRAHFEECIDEILSQEYSSWRKIAEAYHRRYRSPISAHTGKSFEGKLISSLLLDDYPTTLDLLTSRQPKSVRQQLWQREFLNRVDFNSHHSSLSSPPTSPSDVSETMPSDSPAIRDAGLLFTILHLSRSARTRNLPALMRIIESWTGRDIADLNQAYAAQFSTSLAEAITEALPLGPHRELLLFQVRGDTTRAVAAKIRLSLFSLSDTWVGSYFVDRSSAERSQLERDYDATYPATPLLTTIKRHFFGVEREILLEVIELGRFSWGKLCYVCVARLGTDEQGLRWILESIESEEIPLLRSEFHATWRKYAPWYERFWPSLFGTLEHRIWMECGGDSWFDFAPYLRGDATDSSSLTDRLRELQAHERSGWLIKRLDFLSREGAIMDSSIAEALRYARENLCSDPESDFQRNELATLAELNAMIFRLYKRDVAEMLTGLVVAFTVGGVTIGLAVNRVDLAHLMSIVALVSACTRGSVKLLVKGRGYARDEFIVDLFFSGIDGSTLFLNRIFRHAMFKGGARLLARYAARNASTVLSTRRVSRNLRRGGRQIPRKFRAGTRLLIK